MVIPLCGIVSQTGDMESSVENSSTPAGARSGYEELRAAPRFTLLIRSAKIISPSGEFLCIVRDVSSSGVRLRLFHPLPPGSLVTLELASGEHFAMEKVWESEDHAGFRFVDEIDVHRFIAEASPYPRRQLRLRIDFPAILTVDGIASPVMVRDLSRQGARIECDELLAVGQKVKLEAKGLPTLISNVCWRSSPAYGLVFLQLFTFDELARLAEALQLPESAAVEASTPLRSA